MAHYLVDRSASILNLSCQYFVCSNGAIILKVGVLLSLPFVFANSRVACFVFFYEAQIKVESGVKSGTYWYPNAVVGLGGRRCSAMQRDAAKRLVTVTSDHLHTCSSQRITALSATLRDVNTNRVDRRAVAFHSQSHEHVNILFILLK